MTWTVEAEQRQEMARQIGANLMPISGGRVVAIPDGIEMPCGSGYAVRVQLTPIDEYTVSRVFRRGGKEWIRGQREHVFCDEVSEAAYFASCYQSYSETEWPTK